MFSVRGKEVVLLSVITGSEYPDFKMSVGAGAENIVLASSITGSEYSGSGSE